MTKQLQHLQMLLAELIAIAIINGFQQFLNWLSNGCVLYLERQLVASVLTAVDDIE
jgi:hypothetical protein